VSTETSTPKKLKRGATYVIGGGLILLAGISGVKAYLNQEEQRKLAAEIAAGPRVHLAQVKMSSGVRTITLIGESRPFATATLYAKVSGYLKEVLVDKGDVVKQGQTLAVIESPETDQAFQGALADAKNKSTIAKRSRLLLHKKLISAQEEEQAKSDGDVAGARLKSEEVEKGYEILKAPFDGTVTARYVDQGALVQNATTSQTSAQPVVVVSTINRLRVDIFLDQKDAPFVQKGDGVEITMSERPGFKLEGKVARISGELDPRTKTLLTEIDLNNEKEEVVAGSFVQVTLTVKSPATLQVPVEALILKGDKYLLPVISEENKVALREVEVGVNDGKMISILKGVNEGEKVGLSLGASVADGGKVRPIVEEKSGKN
jgi:membrane fusion protein, multidrug efflux system